MLFQRSVLLAVLGLAGCLASTGCESNAGNGALIGGGAGAGLGAAIGHAGHETAGGAIVGGALGAVTGAIVGNEMDRQEARDRYFRDRYYDDDDYYYRHRGYVYEYRVWRDYGPYGPGYYWVREYRD